MIKTCRLHATTTSSECRTFSIVCSYLYSLEPFRLRGKGGWWEGRGREGGSRFARIWGQIQTVISQKRLETTVSIWYSIIKSRGRAIDWARLQSSRTTYKRKSGSKFDSGHRATKLVGNDSSPHLQMFGKVSKPLSAETSEIFKSRPKFRI